MKLKISALSVTAIVFVAVAVLGTLCYFTAEDTATNVITAGNIRIELSEMALSDSTEDFVPFEGGITVMPGTVTSKIVTVRNTGDNPAYIRIKIDKTIILQRESEGEPDTALAVLNINTEEWTEQDGYYYYNTALDAGNETSPLFTTVTFSKDMDNMYQNSTASIKITAYATQVKNNGASVFDAEGWPGGYKE